MTFKRLVFAVAMLCSLAASTAIAPSASAQEADYDLQIFVSTCDATSCDDVESEFLAGAEVVVMDETGNEYGTCATVTDVKPGGCSVMVPSGSTVEVAVLTASIPDGYVALDSPQTYQVPDEKTEVGDVWFYLTMQEDTVPDDQDTDEDVAGGATEGEGETETPTELPSTGSGATQGAPVSASLAVVVTILAAGAAIVTRRRLA